MFTKTAREEWTDEYNAINTKADYYLLQRKQSFAKTGGLADVAAPWELLRAWELMPE